ncbi:MAG TPA: DoxX family protein [Chthoniobacteraceae bacterium]|jgi:uncharacterized membrane protein|nr:hypothetical protein [Chthoniobacter sp.]HEV7866146.1 DoxX family protein [Chthoniobacteraceae bacterium]
MLKTIFRWLLAVFFVAAGANHFLSPDAYVAIVPPYLPAPRLLVEISGAAQIAGGLGALIPWTRRWAGWGLIALLIAVFPANLRMAMHGFEGLPAWMLWVRLPLQAVLIGWVYWTCLTRRKRPFVGSRILFS